MDRNELIKYIYSNEHSYTPEILNSFNSEQLHSILIRMLFNPFEKAKEKCSLCNGSGTVLNVECAKCTGTGTARNN